MRATSGLLRHVAWLLAGLMVVIGFLGVNAISELQARKIDRYAEELEANAVPRFERLTEARGSLQKVTSQARRVVQDKEPERAADQASYDAAIRHVTDEMARYVEIPAYPGEASLRQSAAKDLGVYEKIADTVDLRAKAGDRTGADALLDSELTPASERVDARLQQLVELNATQVAHASEAIRHARIAVTNLSYALHGLAACLAVITFSVVARFSTTYEKLAEARARLESERTELAERRAAELDMFAARVAHDLKNPLGAISFNIASAVRKADDPGHVRKGLDRASHAIRRASEIIDGLLAFARAGGSVDGEAATGVADAVQSVISELASNIERAGAQVEIAPIAPAVLVACSEGQLLSVLENLVGNAVKYLAGVDAANRRVRVRAIDRGAWVRIEVEDTGPGIPSEAEARIFEPYVRGPNAGQPGLGLGLATAKRIVEAHSGSIGVHSTIGRGSCFWFELPTAKDADAAETREFQDLH